MADRRVLPNWIEAYMAYTAEQMSPDEFHQWTALVTIAGAIRRRAFYDMRYFLLYPNLYVVLVAPAGKCKKSTCLRLGRQILKEVPGVSFTSDSTTRERLILDLGSSYADGHSSMTAYSSEFASLLTSSGMDMVVFLTDIYDSPDEWTHRTKIGGTNKLKAPWLNLEGATTPDWIARSLPLDTIGIGLTSRVIFVYHDTPRIRPSFPDPTPEQLALRQMLIHDLQLISDISGQYTPTAEAKAWYEEWDLDRQKKPPLIDDPRLSGYYERKPMHVLKVAMILAAAESNDLLLHQRHMERAVEWLTQLEPRMAKVFAAVGKNPLSYDMEQIMGVIVMKAEEGVLIQELMSQFKHSVRKEELEEVLETLAMIGDVKVVATEQGPRYHYIREKKVIGKDAADSHKE